MLVSVCFNTIRPTHAGLTEKKMKFHISQDIGTVCSTNYMKYSEIDMRIVSYAKMPLFYACFLFCRFIPFSAYCTDLLSRTLLPSA